MTGSQKRKGDRAENEAATLLTRLLHRPIRRLLGAGRHDDHGDLTGIPGWAIQVADWTDLARAVRQKPLDAELQAAHHGDHTHGAALIRLRGGQWRVVMTPETWATLLATTLPPSREQGPPLPDKAPPSETPPFPPEQ